jgi:GPI mannosyltransferase 1 subunit M
LAFILTPNEFVHPTFGKLLFSIADILIGILVKQILAFSSSKINPNPDTPPKEPGRSIGLTRDEIILATIWLLNPLPANISTRGSAESLLGLMVTATLYAAIKRNWDLCAVFLGLSVHWKIYPVIYAGSLLPLIGSVPEGMLPDSMHSWMYYGLKWIGNRQRLRFGLITAISFTGLSAAMYLLYVLAVPTLPLADLRFFELIDGANHFSNILIFIISEEQIIDTTLAFTFTPYTWASQPRTEPRAPGLDVWA